MKLIIYDGDYLVYKVGFAAQEWADFDGDGVGTVWADLGFAKRLLWDNLQRHLDPVLRTGDRVIVALSDPDDNFRNLVDPEYKKHRETRHQAGRRPALYNELRGLYDEGPFDVVQFQRLEADDVLGILATRNPGSVMVSIDKDLQCVPGIHWHPEKQERTEVDEESAERFHANQTLQGDRVDGYFGIPGIGPKKAAKILDGVRQEHLWDAVLAAYEANGLDEEEMLKNARLAYLLRDDDYDEETGEVRLWGSEVTV